MASKPFFFSLAFVSRRMGATAIFCRLVPGRESIAPALMKFSRVPVHLLGGHTAHKILHGTEFSIHRRSVRMACTTGRPTLLMADRP